MTADDDTPVTAIRCVTGHEIELSEVEARTEEVTLDGSAVYRVCREHQAPIEVCRDRSPQKPGSA